jgi:hypothetical protein
MSTQLKKLVFFIAFIRICRGTEFCQLPIESNAMCTGIKHHQPKNQKELMPLLRQNELEEPPISGPGIDHIHRFSAESFACNKTGRKKYQRKTVSPFIVKPIAVNESPQEKSTFAIPRSKSSRQYVR